MFLFINFIFSFFIIRENLFEKKKKIFIEHFFYQFNVVSIFITFYENQLILNINFILIYIMFNIKGKIINEF